MEDSGFSVSGDEEIEIVSSWENGFKQEEVSERLDICDLKKIIYLIL